MDPAIEIRGLSVSFRTGKGVVRALDGLDLTVGRGQVFGFLGPNGAGKTTAMHVLLGFIRADSGEARLLGADVRESIARRRIGYLPESPDTYRFLTGRESVLMAGRLQGLRGQELRSGAERILDLVGMTESAGRRIATYSRGMTQRICLAQALVHDPDLVILDEPTSGLDPIGRLAVRQIIAGLRDRGRTVFFSSHELSEAETVCDHVAILVGGRVAAEGRADALADTGESLEQYFMRVIRESPRDAGGRAGDPPAVE